MSAHLDFDDQEMKVLWITFDGRADELEANLRMYGIEYVAPFHHGRVGITYVEPIVKHGRREFIGASETLIDILTMRQGINDDDRKRFHSALVIVQKGQAGAALCVTPKWRKEIA